MSGTEPVTGPLAALAGEHGVLTWYVDALGTRRVAPTDVVLRVLQALGEPVEAPRDAAASLRRARRERVARIVEPVVVFDELVRAAIEVRLRAPDTALECVIETEDGERIEWSAGRDQLTARRVEMVDGREVFVGSVELPGLLPAGYHSFSVRTPRGRTGAATLIVAPTAGTRGRFADDWRAYGVVAPLFALHSARSWGAGDLGDLDTLGQLLASEQASVVATLPLLAGFGPEHFEASPYLPVSRRFWHERWIELDRVPELAWSARARALVSAARHEGASSRFVSDGVVDGAAALAAKRRVLGELATAVPAAGRAREAALREFLLEHPEVADYSRFRAATERFGVDWRRWPARLRGGLLRWGDVDPVAERYHTYVQWIAHEQMVELSDRMAQRGQTLALDLPVGVHPCGYDTWRHPDQFVRGMTVGAPPDAFFSHGQTWGTPAPHPAALRRTGFRQLREALAHHLRVAGLLRVDHVMGLQRLFWVPDGAEPVDGVYVRMPMAELFAVMAIEAQRHRADIVGEDLGTVDPEVRAAMERVGMRRTYVAQFARGRDEPLEPPPAGSVAAFGTHDLPPFAGWWSGRDIDDRVGCGQLDADAEAAARAERSADRDALASLAGGPGAEPAEVLAAVHAALARSDAGLVLVQLDDLVGATEAANLPGSGPERPNWLRRAAEPVEALARVESARAVLGLLRELRGRGAVAPASGPAHPPETVFGVSRLTPTDVHLFNEGRHFRLYEKLGAHPMTVAGVEGTYFAVWAPNAERLSVIGDFNGWKGERHPLAPHGGSGIWEGFVPGIGPGALYKYRLRSQLGGGEVDKADPFARWAEVPPGTASAVWSPAHEWSDQEWMAGRRRVQGLGRPMSIYEVHLGSWRRVPEEGGRSLSYRELAPRLIDHVREHGFTHVELLPVMEHPFYGSWGYQVTGFFAPTARYGSPDDFAALVDELHRAGIGVILDWVPSHFPADAHALAEFDGTHLYEHADPRQRVHPDWQSWIFNYGRNEVRSFLISNACFWLDRFHVDGLRLDAVASMLYLDYSRQEGEWVPNRFGGNENLEAVDFLQACNSEVYRTFPDVVTIAEESTAWPGVSRPVHQGGLGFGFKWDMGWMHDTLEYLARDPVHRSYHHDTLTFRALYAGTEHFVLPLSHDEVVHGKGSLLQRMAGDVWQKFANLRLLYGYQFTQPGKKLLFMGSELGQWAEWDHERSLDWHLLDLPHHAGVASWVRELNELYRSQAPLHRDDLLDGGFAWIDCSDRTHSVVVFERYDDQGGVLVVAANFTPVPRSPYRVGLPGPGAWELVANSDEVRFGGSGFEVPAEVEGADVPWHGRQHSADLVLPPLGLVVLRPAGARGR